jgi:hypothetical protein
MFLSVHLEIYHILESLCISLRIKMHTLTAVNHLLLAVKYKTQPDKNCTNCIVTTNKLAITAQCHLNKIVKN